MKALIHAEKCAGIDVCAKVCPVNAISGDVRAVHAVDQSKCIGCGMCEARCPKKAIELVPASGAAAEKTAKKEMVAV